MRPVTAFPSDGVSLKVLPQLVLGVLPEGIHPGTIEEVDEAFGRFQRTDRRIRLTAQLRELLNDARRSGIVAALVIDGSYVTRKDEPGDIAIVVAIRPDFDLSQELRPFEYRVVSKRMIRLGHQFDARVLVDGSELYHEAVDFFARVRRDDPDQADLPPRKGLVRIEL